MREKLKACYLDGEFYDWDDIFDQMTPTQLAEEVLLRVRASEDHAERLNDAFQKNYELAGKIQRLEKDLADARAAIHVVKSTMRARYDAALLSQCRHDCPCSKLEDDDELE